MNDGLTEAERPWHRRRLWQIAVVRDVFWIALAVFALGFGYQLRGIFTPVLIGLALAYLFQPPINYMQRRWRVPRPVAISLILVVLIVGGLAFAAWMGPKFVHQIEALATRTPGYIKALAAKWNIDLSQVQNQLQGTAAAVQADPTGYLLDWAGMLLAGTGQAVGIIGSILSTATYLLITAVLIPIYFFFFAWHLGPIVRHVESFLPVSRRDRILRVLGRMDQLVSTYFRSRVIIAIIMGALLSAGWAATSVPYWFLLGAGCGLLSLVPYASLIVWPLAVGLKWLDVISGTHAAGFDMVTVVLLPSLVFAAVQMLDMLLLTPVIQGRSLDMSVVTIIIVVLLGGAMGGLYGLLLCIPIAACVKVLLQDVFLPRLRAWAAQS